jgi:membrane protein DedA with SNARE-associated domain
VDEAARVPSPEPAPPQPGGFTVTRTDLACIGPIVVLVIWAYASLPLGPLLIGPHPVLLSALRGSTSSLIASGAKGPIWLSMIAPIFIVVADNPFYYWAGRRYGRRVLDYYAGQSPRWKRRVGRGERFFARWGVWTIVLAPYQPIPSQLLWVAAGESRMPIWQFAVADAVANLSWIALWVALGWKLGSRASAVADWISSYGWKITLGLLGAVVVYAVVRGVRTARAMGK